MPNYGSYTGDTKTAWLNEPDDKHRDMRVLEEITYTDPDQTEWTVPANGIVNGASIPAILWSKVGCPYIGNYRRATVFHDHYCDHHQGRTHEAVHLMFYYAMLADGVSKVRASIMYQAVKMFGPKWDPASGADQSSLPITENDLEKLIDAVEQVHTEEGGSDPIDPHFLTQRVGEIMD